MLDDEVGGGLVAVELEPGAVEPAPVEEGGGLEDGAGAVAAGGAWNAVGGGPIALSGMTERHPVRARTARGS